MNRARLRNQAELGGVLEIQFEAAAVFRVEREVDVCAQIRFERALRQLQVLRSFVADFAEVREAEIARSQKVGSEVRCGQFAAHRPDCENSGQTSQRAPLGDRVVNVKQFGADDAEGGRLAYRLARRALPTVFFDGERNAQGGIADEER